MVDCKAGSGNCKPAKVLSQYPVRRDTYTRKLYILKQHYTCMLYHNRRRKDFAKNKHLWGLILYKLFDLPRRIHPKS